MKKKNIGEYFAEVETTIDYNGYFFSVSAALTISILGTFCGLRNMQQIHQWASNDKIKKFLSENFGIEYSGSLVKTEFLENIMNEHNNLIPANINHAV